LLWTFHLYAVRIHFSAAFLIVIGHERDLGVVLWCDKSEADQLAAMVGSAAIIDAANDNEAIAQAEVVRGSFAAELLDIEGLRVKYLPGAGRRQK
jgi:hypothetical protein